MPHSAARADVTSDRPPVLLIAAGADHLVTAGCKKANFELIRKSSAPTDFKESPGRPHFTGVVEGWEAVADFALE